MDLSALKSIALRLRHELKREGIHVDCVLLFGSRARGENREDSDYDLAVISRDFGKDRFSEGVLVNLHAQRLHPDIEAIPISVHDILDPFPVSPIVHEIKQTGITLI